MVSDLATAITYRRINTLSDSLLFLGILHVHYYKFLFTIKHGNKRISLKQWLTGFLVSPQSLSGFDSKRSEFPWV